MSDTQSLENEVIFTKIEMTYILLPEGSVKSESPLVGFTEVLNLLNFLDINTIVRNHSPVVKGFVQGLTTILLLQESLSLYHGLAFPRLHKAAPTR